MTIDEAIAKHKVMQQSSKLHNDKRGVFYNAQEHDQLVKWLEELKYYKNDYGDIVSKIAIFEADKLKIYNCGYMCGYMLGYNKAIDNFVEKLKRENKETIPTHSGYCRMSFDEVVDELAEQLKEGILND